MNKSWPDDRTIQRYLIGMLSQEELDDFEASMLADPQFLNHIRTEAALREGVKALGLGESAAHPAKVSARGPSSAPGWLQRLQNLVTSPAWAWPASALAGVALFALVSPQPPASTALINEIVYVDQNRSSTDTTIELKAGESALLAIDAIAWEQSGVVNIAITGPATALTFDSAPVGQLVEVYVPLRGLSAGEYLLVLSGSGIEQRYVVKAL